MPACLPACLPFSKGDELTYALNARIYSGRKVLAAKRFADADADACIRLSGSCAVIQHDMEVFRPYVYYGQYPATNYAYTAACFFPVRVHSA
jgi:hypothetical protein